MLRTMNKGSLTILYWRVAPAPLPVTLLAFTTLVAPTALSASMAWPPWCGALLSLPGLLIYLRANRSAGSAIQPPLRERLRTISAYVGTAAVVVSLIVIRFIPSVYRPLAFAGFIVFTDVVWRMVLAGTRDYLTTKEK